MKNIVFTLIFALASLFAYPSAMSLGDERGAASGPSPASTEPRDTMVFLRNKGDNVEGVVAIRRADDAVERHYVSNLGLRCSIGTGDVILRYVNRLSDVKVPLLHGEMQIGGVETQKKETVLALQPATGRVVTIKAIGPDGAPLGKTTLELCEVWKGREVDTLNMITDKAGAIQANLADDCVYKVRMRWRGYSVPSESPSFTPHELKTPEFTFSPLPPEATGFTIRLVIAEGATKQLAKDIQSLEITGGTVKNAMVGGVDGKIVLRFTGTGSYAVGDKLSLRLPMGAAKKYRIMQPVIEVGKAGASVDVEIVPAE